MITTMAELAPLVRQYLDTLNEPISYSTLAKRVGCEVVDLTNLRKHLKHPNLKTISELKELAVINYIKEKNYKTTQSDIVRETGITSVTIQRILNKNNITLINNTKGFGRLAELTEEEKEFVRSNTHMTLTDIAKQIKRTNPVISRFIEKENLSISTLSSSEIKKKRMAYVLKNKHRPSKLIAKELGVSQATVQMWGKELGIKFGYKRVNLSNNYHLEFKEYNREQTDTGGTVRLIETDERRGQRGSTFQVYGRESISKVKDVLNSAVSQGLIQPITDEQMNQIDNYLISLL